jgi:hypothetical protein
MSIQNQLADLIATHGSLEASLAEALKHPASTDDEITALKRQKLRIKDRISALEQQLREAQSMPES